MKVGHIQHIFYQCEEVSFEFKNSKTRLSKNANLQSDASGSSGMDSIGLEVDHPQS